MIGEKQLRKNRRKWVVFEEGGRFEVSDLFEMLKRFVTVEGEFEFTPDMINSDAALCLDFVEFLRSSGWTVESPQQMERVAEILAHTLAPLLLPEPKLEPIRPHFITRGINWIIDKLKEAQMK